MTARSRSSSKSSFSRDAWLEINLNALEHNCKEIKEQVKQNSKIMAVVKSDAYGHGASTVSPVLEACGIDYFGVASVDEGIQVKDSGVSSPVLILSPTPSWAFVRAITHDLEITVSSIEQVKELEKIIKRNQKKITAKTSSSISSQVKIQIKINTGMNRNGAKWSTEAKDLIEYVLSKKDILKLTGVFSHFACGDNEFLSQVQIDRFKTVIKQFKKEELGLIHIDASSSLKHKGLTDDFDMVRVGLFLYGLGASNLNLKPCLGLIARISQLQKVNEGEGVGYGLTWRAKRESLIGLLPLGYADGMKRNLSNRMKAIYKDKLIEQVGTISMDQTTFDFTDCLEPNSSKDCSVKIGDQVTLIGNSESQEIQISDWSSTLGTIDYEVACDLRARLPRVYVRK